MDKKKGIGGYCLVLVIGTITIIFLNLFCRKNYLMILPKIMFWIGCAVIIVGIILRLYSEKILENNFKTQYKEYKKNTKRIIPFIW
ncbi:protein-S-isoprenylcysteine O-methyltransferase Ste14 [Clostridium beijerinckii]|nr:protein-S-isoprenylcysteine O-methyltransferase Ste14 [Clostridium beijerinckii]NRZ21807.1 protein-S-isoprenylcysteine O-methyltransferase Ste14 [Clostridium beijerinckii]